MTTLLKYFFEYLLYLFILTLITFYFLFLYALYIDIDGLKNNNKIPVKNKLITYTKIENERLSDPLIINCNEYECVLNEKDCVIKDDYNISVYKLCNYRDFEIYYKSSLNIFCKAIYTNKVCLEEVVRLMEYSFSDFKIYNIFKINQYQRDIIKINRLFENARRSENNEIMIDVENDRFIIIHGNGATIFHSHRIVIDFRLRISKIELIKLLKSIEIHYI
jgi:hypothetical protein